LVAWLEGLNASLGLPRLSGCRGVDAETFNAQLSKMAGDAIASGSPANNPRVPGVEEIMEIYRAAW